MCRRKRIEVPLNFLAKGVNPRIPLRVLYLRGTITLALRMGVVGLKGLTVAYGIRTFRKALPAP